jgi:hypothetical protein
MPYISQELRNDVDPYIDKLNKFLMYVNEDKIDGIMNYVITSLMKSQYDAGHYQQYNSAVGVLECVKLELYSRVIRPYEDKKCQENGDVY